MALALEMPAHRAGDNIFILVFLDFLAVMARIVMSSPQRTYKQLVNMRVRVDVNSVAGDKPA